MTRKAACLSQAAFCDRGGSNNSNRFVYPAIFMNEELIKNEFENQKEGFVGL